MSQDTKHAHTTIQKQSAGALQICVIIYLDLHI